MSTAGRRTRDSFEEAADAFAELERKMKEVPEKGLRAIGEEVMTDVKNNRHGKGVPEEDGHLRSSGTVEGPKADGTVVLAFGGPAAPYAIVQHERVDYHHPDVGEARYLVRGVERWQPDGSAAMRAMRANTVQAIARSGSITAGGSFPSAPSL